MEDFSWTATITFLIDLLIRLGLSVRVIMRRRPVGVSLASLVIVLLVPFAGAVIYLFVGELRQDGVPTLALQVDGAKYFWFHHTQADTSIPSLTAESFNPSARSWK